MGGLFLHSPDAAVLVCQDCGTVFESWVEMKRIQK
jgi:hypothetical protein